MGKTAKDPAKKKKWMKIGTARDFKMSHTEGTKIKTSDRDYRIAADGSWRRL